MQGLERATAKLGKSISDMLRAADVRTAIVKGGGKMADSGSVLFNFQRQGQIYVKGSAATEEEASGSPAYWHLGTCSGASAACKVISPTHIPTHCWLHLLSHSAAARVDQYAVGIRAAGCAGD